MEFYAFRHKRTGKLCTGRKGNVYKRNYQYDENKPPVIVTSRERAEEVLRGWMSLRIHEIVKIKIEVVE